MSARHSRYAKRKSPENTEPVVPFSVTLYDTELARLASERNEAYGLLEDLDRFARNLSGDYAPVGAHILRIMYGEENV